MAFLKETKLFDTLKGNLQTITNIDWHSGKTKLVILTGIAVPITYFLVEKCREIWLHKVTVGNAVNKFPGPPTKALTGNLHLHPGPNEKALKWFAEMAKEYKYALRFWMGPLRPVVVLVHPDTVKQLLKTAEPKIVTNYSSYCNLVPWLGHGLLTAGGARWARNRRLLTPAFHFDVLKPYIDIYNECAEKLIGNLLKNDLSKGSVDIYPLISLCTLDTVLRCAFSSEDDVQSKGKTHPYVSAVITIAELLVRRAFKPWLGYGWVYSLTSDGKKFKQSCDYVHQVADAVITKRRNTLKEDPTARREKYPDFLDILLSARDEDGNGLTDLEIRQEVDTFLFEGHDTTASAISWTLYSLAEHPDIQEKARQEAVKELAQTETNSFEWESLGKLAYLTQCIKEGMRMHAPVPGFTRELSRELSVGGIELPRCTRVNISVYALHHNSHVWGDDHMEFKPNRFHPDVAKSHDPHAFVPFSTGPSTLPMPELNYFRNCIGQNFAMGEMKVIIGKLLQRWSSQGLGAGISSHGYSANYTKVVLK